MRRIQIEGPFETSYSLAIVNRGLARALERLQPGSVALFATEGPGDYHPRQDDLRDKPDIESLWKRSSAGFSPEVTIRNMYPPRVNDVDQHRLNLFYLFWEDSLIPQEWADDFNRYLDGILVPSNHVAESLTKSGVFLPMSIVHVGVDPLDPFRNSDAGLSRLIRTDKSVRFLHVSSGFPRKGCDILLQAYADEFTSGDDVSLIIKTFPNIHNTVGRQIENVRSARPMCPEIIHIDEDLDSTAMSGLYSTATCLVHPARAEGFGLPVAEAMLSGIPVIATGYSGLTEFCFDETALLLDFEFVESASHFNVPGATWAEPDTGQLRAHMRKIFESPSDEAVQSRVANARKLVRERFTWDRVAAGTLKFIDGLGQQRSPEIKACMVTSWNSRCGIAEYSKHLIEATVRDRVSWRILARKDEQPLIPDGSNVARCWKGFGDPDLLGAIEHAGADDIDVVHFQFNFAFFRLEELSAVITDLKARGKTILMTFHSTRDVSSSQNLVSLGTIADTLKLVDLILVHSPEDRERLHSWGISGNVVRFPHGFIDFAPEDRRILRHELGLHGSPIIATFGFLLPHKGVLQLIEAAGLLKKKHGNLLLIAATALHPAGPSTEYLAECRRMIDDLGLAGDCRILTEYLTIDEVMIVLQASDVIVMPYQSTNESSSAAVRLPLASGRPVIATSEAIFDDVHDSVFRIDSAQPELIASGIERVIGDPALALHLESRARNRVRRDCWENVSRMYLRFLRFAVNRGNLGRLMELESASS